MFHDKKSPYFSFRAQYNTCTQYLTYLRLLNIYDVKHNGNTPVFPTDYVNLWYEVPIT